MDLARRNAPSVFLDPGSQIGHYLSVRWANPPCQGFYNITGLAWSGRGKIKQVDVSIDGGSTGVVRGWKLPVLSKALTRFNVDWVWDGNPRSCSRVRWMKAAMCSLPMGNCVR